MGEYKDGMMKVRILFWRWDDMMKDEVVVKLKGIVPKYSDIFDKVILFGSVARDENTSKSDLDLYIELGAITILGLGKSKQYAAFLAELYDTVTFEDYDILEFSRGELKQVHQSLLYKEIQKDGIIIYDKRAKAI